MKVIPTLDILDDKVVRLRQGRREDATVYSDDPVATARRWKEEGAQYLHIVDLNGAFEGGHTVTNVCRRIRDEVGIPFQVGGGIRLVETAKAYLDAGADRIVVGTAAVTDGNLFTELIHDFGRRVVAAVDSRDDLVLFHGWTEVSEFHPGDLAEVLKSMGARRLLLTDVARDGMEAGPNVDLLRMVAKRCGLPLIASGGVSKPADIEALRGLGKDVVEGVILGRAIY
ncbi:MAG: 1-(5-phosphoribosyl)-5-[(5-phosphoribosylamino)methylideneamino]imidazole-4-carboxamide isomerase, partial [Candidatus Eisenbacteria bacterium]